MFTTTKVNKFCYSSLHLHFLFFLSLTSLYLEMIGAEDYFCIWWYSRIHTHTHTHTHTQTCALARDRTRLDRPISKTSTRWHITCTRDETSLPTAGFEPVISGIANPLLKPNGQLHSYDKNPPVVFPNTAFAEHKISNKSCMRIELCGTLYTASQNALSLIRVL